MSSNCLLSRNRFFFSAVGETVVGVGDEVLSVGTEMTRMSLTSCLLFDEVN